MRLAAIVEGHGEVEAVPILIERILNERAPGAAIDILRKPHRVPRGKMLSAELARAIELQARRVRPDGAILVLLDSDDDCAATLGPKLQQAAQAAATDVPIGVVLAVREYESWLVASEVDAAIVDLQPETLADAKRWLKERWHRYSPTVDQPKLTARIDLAKASSLSSFRKLLRELGRLTNQQLEDA